MESAATIGSSTVLPIFYSPRVYLHNNRIGYGFRFSGNGSRTKICAILPNGSASHGAQSSSAGDMHRLGNSLQSEFCYDKPIPEERIETAVGVALAEKVIGDNPRCTECQAKGAVLCATCSGSGLYVDAIMESQGIIVKIRCLGCGGTGNIMCSECGGRGHLGPK